MRALEWLFVIALIMYTAAIWSHKITGKLHPAMVSIFGIGLVADAAGTWYLCVAAGAQWAFTLHIVSGLAALIIMTLHFSWAVLALSVVGKFQTYFNKYSISAWIIWLVAFISGIPL